MPTSNLTKLIVMAVLLLVSVATIAFGLFAHPFIHGWTWVNVSFHAALETAGAFTALTLAFFMLMMGRFDKRMPFATWVVCGLTAMGIFDGLHAMVAPGNTFVWLHSLAVLTGGMGFALTWLLERFSPESFLRQLPKVTACIALVIGLFSIAYPETLPAMLHAGKFTVSALAMNVASGILFLAAAGYFILRHIVTKDTISLLFGILSLLCGVAGLLFLSSEIWEADWWFWHLTRLSACIIALMILYRSFRLAVDALRQSAREMAARNRIAEVFLTVPDQEMYAQVLAIILEVMASKYGVFGYIDEHGSLVVPTMSYTAWEKCQVPDKRFVFQRESWGDSAWPRAIREQRTICLNEPSTRTPEGHIAISRHICVPLIHQGEVVGLLQIANKATDYTAADVSLLETIGNAIAPVLDARVKGERQETARCQAEEALRASNERFDLAVKGTNDGIWDWEIATNINYFSPRFCELLGYGPGELIQELATFDSLLHPDDRDGIFTRVRQHLEEQLPYRVEYRLRTKSGEYRWFQARGQAIWDQTGKPLRMAGSITDITERKSAEEEQSRLLSMLHATSDFVGFADAGDTHILYINPAGRKMTGVGAEEDVTQLKIADVHPEWTNKLFRDEIIPAATRDGIWKGECAFLNRDGSEIPVMMVLLAHMSASGEVERFSTISRDITERKNAEEALRRSEENLAVTLQSIGDGVLVIDTERRVVRLNPVAEQLTGWVATEALGRAVEEVFRIINEETRRPAIIPVEEVLATGLVKGLANHTVLIARDGTERPIADSAAPIRDREGGLVGVVLVFRDVTAEREAEKTLIRFSTELERQVRERTADLQEAEARYHMLFEESPGGLLVIDPETTQPIEFNEVAHRQLGYGREEFSRLRISDYEVVEQPEEVIQHIEQIMRDGRSDFETKHRAKDGAMLDMVVTACKMELAGRPVLYCIFRDITEHKKIAAAERSRQAAEAANQVKSEFLANMSHELRTPLNSIIGFADVMLSGLSGELNEKQQENTSYIMKSGQHLLRLINDILDLAKVEAGKVTPEFAPLRLRDALEDSLVLFKEKAFKHQIDLTLSIEAAADIEIEADERRLKQIVFNLVGNAMKFTPDGGAVTVAARLSIADCGIVVSVSDTGIGIKPEGMQKLFIEFSQIDSTFSKKYEGTGLGLALTRRLVELHHGRIWATSDFGKGSVFTFVLPVRQKQAERGFRILNQESRIKINSSDS